MDPNVTIIVEGDDLDLGEKKGDLESVGARIKPVDASRGVISAAGKALSWILEFTGGAGAVADKLISLAGSNTATVKVQIGTTVVEVTDARRSDVIALLEKAGEIARGANEL